MKKLIFLLLTVALLNCTIKADPILIQLEWTAPGDDGMVGTASMYDIRYMECSDTLSYNWDDAIVIPNDSLPIPSLAGTKDSVILNLGFKADTYYCFAIKTADEVPNWSNISNIAIIKTPDKIIPGTIQTLILRLVQ